MTDDSVNSESLTIGSASDDSLTDDPRTHDPTTTVRVALSAHLRTLASVDGELKLEVVDPPTVNTVLDALESRYPMLRGTIRDHGTHQRRAFIRYFACGRDLSHDPPEARLPNPVSAGTNAFRVVGAIAGG